MWVFFSFLLLQGSVSDKFSQFRVEKRGLGYNWLVQHQHEWWLFSGKEVWPNKLIYGMHSKSWNSVNLPPFCAPAVGFSPLLPFHAGKNSESNELLSTLSYRKKSSRLYGLRRWHIETKKMDGSTYLPIFVILREAGSTANSPRFPLFTATTRLFVTLSPSSFAMSRVNVKLKMATTLPRLQKKTERPRQ